MNILKTVLMALHIIVCIVIIILSMMQTSEDGASNAITGNSSNSFYDKNKGKTREGILKKLTVIFGVIFAITTIVFGVVYSIV